MRLTRTAACVAALDVGGTTLKGALADPAGELLWRRRQATRREEPPETVLDDILAMIDELVDQGRALVGPDGVAGVGLTVPGLIDSRSGTVVHAPNLRLCDVPLLALARERSGLPTVITHRPRSGVRRG
jgi:glucokinase